MDAKAGADMKGVYVEGIVAVAALAAPVAVRTRRVLATKP